MHVRNYFLLFLIVLGVVVSGCNKDDKLENDEIKPEARQISRIDRYDEKQNNVEICTLTYDSQGRIAEIASEYLYPEDPEWEWEWRESYSYPDAGTLVITYFGDTNYDGKIDSQDDYVETATLNDSGYVTSVKGNNEFATESRFVYTDGYLTKTGVFDNEDVKAASAVKSAYGGMLKNLLPDRKALTKSKGADEYFKYTVYEWKDGSLASWQNRDTDGWKGNLYTYAYDLKIRNKPCGIDLFWLITDEETIPLNMFGKSSQYLPDTESFQDEDGLYAATIAYRYERDDSDYVTKIFEKRKGNVPESLKYQITYQVAE